MRVDRAQSIARTDGVRAAPTAIVLVEGVSDQIAVEVLAARLGRDLARERVAVVPTGGAGAIGRVVAEYAATALRLAVLCDADEQARVRRSLDTSGRDIEVFVCVDDLEDELIRAVGVGPALAMLESEGDLRSFTTLQKQAAWCEQPVDLQLRRFIGAGARRKARYARLFIDTAVGVDRVPEVLARVLEAACGDRE